MNEGIHTARAHNTSSDSVDKNKYINISNGEEGS